MRRCLMLLVILGAVVVAPAAYAAAESFTVTEKGVTESFTDVLPCVSDSADITITYNSVFHVTELDNGTYHVTGTLAGTFTAVADGVTYTGHFAQWFGENQNTRNSEGSTTFIVNGRGADPCFAHLIWDFNSATSAWILRRVSITSSCSSPRSCFTNRDATAAVRRDRKPMPTNISTSAISLP
jgi:hypothetical protein